MENTVETLSNGPHASPPGFCNAREPVSPIALAELLAALQAMQAGDFSVRLPASQTGIVGKIADTFNEIVANNERMAQQLERVGGVVGCEGKTRQRIKLGSSKGAWRANWRPTRPNTDRCPAKWAGWG